MNIDHLRWILAGFGVILIAGIYIWERFRRKRARNPKHNVRSDSDLPAGAFSLKAGVEDLDGSLDLPSIRVDAFDPLFADGIASNAEPETEATSVPDHEPPESDDPFGIVQIKVTAYPGNSFTGSPLINALRAIGLEYGSMRIFHKHRGRGQPPLFSVVNMVEPGTFPVDDPSRFESPGVVFFLQVAALDQPLVAFDEMIRAAHSLALRISGEIRDAENQVLTTEKTKSIRESLVQVAG